MLLETTELLSADFLRNSKEHFVKVLRAFEELWRSFDVRIFF